MKHGYAFGDHIKTEKIKRRRYDDGSSRALRLRGFLLPIILVVVGLSLVFKLFALQVVQGQKYSQLSDSNRLRTLVIHAPRGVIFDRNGVPLVFNIPGFLQITKDKSGTKSVALKKEDALAQIAKGARNIEVDSLRQYPYKDAMSQILGYIGQISKDEVKSENFLGYQPTDWVGKSGIEQTYEHMLRGTDGRQLLEVDAMNTVTRLLGRNDPLPGQDITLTVDTKLQQAAYDASDSMKKGAVIVSRPDGEILALVSKPSFDPNLFTLDKTYKSASTSAYTKISDILTDGENHPLLNRAIGGVYPPGSTFKLVTAVSGLETHVIDDQFGITDTGILKVGDFSYANWFYTEYGKKEQGKVDVVRAIARSNDIFFYKLGEKLSVDKLSKTAKEFGLGNILGIDLAGEAAGLVPTKQWKEKVIGEKWYLGDDFHFGIGQGYLLTTPLQVNSWTQVIANGGTLYQPHLIKGSSPVVKNKGIVSDKTLELVRKGMIESCSPGGVAFPLFDFKVKNASLKIDGKDIQSVASASADYRKISVACKTGTAQHGDDKTLPHAWITLFAPAYHPQVVVTVLVESSGEGSVVAAPIAKKVLESYFGK